MFMGIEAIGSRKNQYIVRLRKLAGDGAFRREQGEFVCDGIKLLQEALEKGAQVRSVLWKGQAAAMPGLESARQYVAETELFDYASPMKNSPGPLFTVAIPDESGRGKIKNAIVLENVQDPGNVGTVLRTAKAMDVDAVILVGACADVYSPKTVRATMGAIFRQRIFHTDIKGLRALADENGMKLYGAALSQKAVDIRRLEIKNAMVCVGSEGQGLSRELLDNCDGELIIPMSKDSESLNAAVAASLIMWEMAR
jgi:TrmH family RNA methyltransferase